MKLLIKVLLFPVYLILSVVVMIGKTCSNLFARIAGIGMLLLSILILFCLFNKEWLNVMILFSLAVFIVGLQMFTGVLIGLLDTLKDLIF